MINDHNEMSDEMFLKAFRDATLPPELFTHEAHLRLAYLHIQQSGIENASQIVSDQIIKYVKKLGAKDKYHHTVTIASVKAVGHFMEGSKSDNFYDFISEFPQLITKLKSLLASHYSFEIFDSELAKRTFIQPDLQEF